MKPKPEVPEPQEMPKPRPGLDIDDSKHVPPYGQEEEDPIEEMEDAQA
jgi:hypothetical protein